MRFGAGGQVVPDEGRKTRSFPGPGCCDHARARCFGWMGADEGDMGGGKEEEKEEEEEEEEGQPDWTNLPAWLLQYHESGVFTVRHLLRDPDEEDSTLESTEVWTARDDTQQQQQQQYHGNPRAEAGFAAAAARRRHGLLDRDLSQRHFVPLAVAPANLLADQGPDATCTTAPYDSIPTIPSRQRDQNRRDAGRKRGLASGNPHGTASRSAAQHDTAQYEVRSRVLCTGPLCSINQSINLIQAALDDQRWSRIFWSAAKSSNAPPRPPHLGEGERLPMPVTGCPRTDVQTPCINLLQHPYRHQHPNPRQHQHPHSHPHHPQPPPTGLQFVRVASFLPSTPLPLPLPGHQCNNSNFNLRQSEPKPPPESLVTARPGHPQNQASPPSSRSPHL
ncbi:unnamed protein product [Diplocarpon coronariae]